MTAAEMTDALVQINDRLADAARTKGSGTATFYCECGHCLAEEMALSPDEHEEIRAREDLIFAPGHDTRRRYRQPARPTVAPSGSSRELLVTSALRVLER